jgi:glycosyltransferase involved in cell wall biosynthesis
VITVSLEIKEELGRSDAHVIPMGIDKELFRPLARTDARVQLGWPLDEHTVLFVGDTKNPVKRFGLARDAVMQAVGSASFPIVLRVCNNVAPETMPVYMNAADVLVITSEHEGGPLVLREALACNLPVVSVDVGDARMRLARVPGCILAVSDRPEAIASALVNVLKECKHVDGINGISELDDQIIAQELLTIYKGVCAHGR